MIVVREINTHGWAASFARKVPTVLYCAGQPMVVRSNPALIGARLYLNRLALKLIPIMVLFVTL